MDVKMKPIPRMTLEAFADQHGLTMEVHERSPGDWAPRGNVQPYFAHFENTDVKDGPVLIGAFGNGSTPDEAMTAYATEISNKRLVVAAGAANRREITVPYLHHTGTRDSNNT